MSAKPKTPPKDSSTAFVGLKMARGELSQVDTAAHIAEMTRSAFLRTAAAKMADEVIERRAAELGGRL